MTTLVNDAGNAYVRTDNPRQIDRLVEQGWQVVNEVKPPQESGNGAKDGEKPGARKRPAGGTKMPKRAENGQGMEG